MLELVYWAHIKETHIVWSTMAKGKGAKVPLFQHQNFIVQKTYFKYQPSKGEGTKKSKKIYINNKIK